MVNTTSLTITLILVALGVGIFILKPLPSCTYYITVNLLIFVITYCGNSLSVFGFEPNTFAAVVVITLGLVYSVVSMRRSR